jgi:hypothetical protein
MENTCLKTTNKKIIINKFATKNPILNIRLAPEATEKPFNLIGKLKLFISFAD